MFKRSDALDLLNMILCEGDLKSFNVRMQVLDLAPTNDGEDVGSLLEDIGDGDFQSKSA